MINELFVYNNADNKAEINEDVLLIKEFKALASTERNKCKEDPTGTQLLRMQRELTYIYLMLSWKSPYADYEEQVRHKDVIEDAGLTEEEFKATPMIETTSFAGNYYGTPEKEFVTSCIGIVDVPGAIRLREICRNKNRECYIIGVDCADRRTLYARMLMRGDDPRIAALRVENDSAAFRNVAVACDHVFYTDVPGQAEAFLLLVRKLLKV